jgi:integrase
MAKHKKQRRDYVGCSPANHRGMLRLEWRRLDDPTKRATWSTGDAFTRENVEKWEPTRKLVGALRAQGKDPLPHLREQRPGSPSLKPVTSGAITIRTYSPEWLETKTSVRPALLRDYRDHLRAYILPDAIADIPLSDLRPMDIALFQSRMRKRLTKRTRKPLSEKTVQNVIAGSLAALLRDAAVEDYVKRNLFVGLTWKQWKIPPADPLTAEEWERVEQWFQKRTYTLRLERRSHPAFFAFVFFLRWHGVRPSEAAGLSWDDVDLGQGIAYITHSYVEGTLGEPKTRSARRSIELHPTMVTLLKSLRPLRPSPGAIVFPNLDGRRIRLKTFGCIWEDCLQACRIRHRGIYCLKDSFVTHTLKRAEETGDVEKLTAWLVRQTGVRLDTLKRHYEKQWPRDTAAIHATYAMLDENCHPIATPRLKNAG